MWSTTSTPTASILLYPKYKGGRPKTFTLPERREIKKIAKSEPTEHDLPFSTWSLTKHKDPDREPRRRRANHNRYGGVRHLFAALDLTNDKLYGHIKPIVRRTQFLEYCRYLRSLYPPTVRIAIVCDNFSPHLT